MGAKDSPSDIELGKAKIRVFPFSGIGFSRVPGNAIRRQCWQVTSQRPDHEFLFFSLLLQFTSYGGDLGSPHLDNVVR